MLLIKDVRLPDGRRVNVSVKKDVIVGIGDYGSNLPMTKNHDEIEGNGNLLVPGLIDLHVHYRDFGQEEKEDWPHGVAAALAGGVTTVGDMPNNKIPITNIELLEDKLMRVGRQPISARFWFGATPTNYREFADLKLYDSVLGVKMYMGSSTGDLLVSNESEQRRVLEACAEHDLWPAIHAEDEELMALNRQDIPNPLVTDHCKIRNKKVEISAVKRALKLQREVGRRLKLYFCHVSCPESLELIRDQKDMGYTILAEVCPHHLFLDEGQLSGGNGFFKMNPPLRTPADIKRMNELIVRNDFVDVIGSDHAPHTLQEKREREYDRIPSGVPGVQTILPTTYKFVAEGKMSLKRFIDLTSGNAGRKFFGGLRGTVEIGKQADLVIIDTEHLGEITDRAMKSKMKFTPFEGMPAYGAIRKVIVGGKPRDF